MPMNIIYEPDILFETLGLLYYSHHFEEKRAALVNEFSEFGINGEVFYQQHLKILDKYILSFNKNRTTNPEEEFFFGDMEAKFLFFYADTLIRNKEYLTMLESVEDNHIKTELLKSLQMVCDYIVPDIDTNNLESVIDFLGKSDLKESIKWKIMQFFYKPKEQLQVLTQLANINVEAYKKAIKVVDKPLSVLINSYSNLLSSENPKKLLKRVEMSTENITIYPTLIFAVGQISFADYHYFGLLNQVAFEKTHAHSNTLAALSLKLKAFSDNSKLQILLSLKDSQKYNLEIAEQLGLTAATMSHHMNVLLGCDLVGVTKKQGRVYYHIESENIQSFIKDFQKLFS